MKSLNKLEEFLRDNGWHTWYAESYWCHPDVVKDHWSQDYTNYGMPLKNAVLHQMNGMEKIGPFHELALRAFAHESA